jgi:hypothetical protein
MRNSRKRGSTAVGTSLIEVLLGLVLIVPILLAGIDLLTIFCCSIANFSLCKEAARAASQGPPDCVVKNGPQDRAARCIAQAKLPNSIVIIHPDVEVHENLQSQPTDIAVYGGQVRGTVSVKTIADVTPMFVVPLVLGKRVIQLTAEQTYPYSWTVEPQSVKAQ